MSTWRAAIWLQQNNILDPEPEFVKELSFLQFAHFNHD